MSDEMRMIADAINGLTRAIVNNQGMVDKIDVLVAGQAEQKGTLGSLKDTAESQLRALFANDRDHSSRISDIEKRYVERADCTRVSDDNRKEHERYTEKIGKLDVSVGKLVAISSFVAGGVSAITHVVLYMMRVKGG